jgi:signal transduction histidine kinase
MNIRNKLTIIFTLIVALLLFAFNLSIFYISQSYIKKDFYGQLKDRALIVATIFLQQDEKSASYINSFRKKYLSTLPEEIIRAYNYKNEPVFIDSTDRMAFQYPLINKVRQKEEYAFQQGNKQGFGIFYRDNQGDFVIIASATDQSGIKNLNQLRKALIVGFLVSIIVVFISGRYFTRIMLQPIASIIRQATNISETNLHLRLHEGNKKDELATLSATINRMLQRLENAFEMQKSFVHNSSHELRTPLTAIIGNIDVILSKERTNQEYRVALNEIMLEAEKLHKLINGLLGLAQSSADVSNLKRKEIRIDELLFELKDKMRAKYPSCELELIFPSMPEDSSLLTIRGDEVLLETAMLNLLDNACKFSDCRNVKVYLFPDDQEITVQIHDSGIGIAENEIPHITETLYRASNALPYTGSGLGLALTEKIIQLHKGKMRFSSVLNQGTQVTISFPLKFNS